VLCKPASPGASVHAKPIDFILGHSAKDFSLKVTSFSEKNKSVKLIQFSKALSPTVVNEGKVNKASVIEEQPEKALLCNVVKLLKLLSLVILTVP
jgi:hypothetical protein